MQALSPFRRMLLVAMPCCALGAAQGQEAEEQARMGAVADGVTSAVGVASRAIAVNPLLPLVGVGLKVATFQHAESLPETERPRAYAFAAATWQASAAGNACATASTLSGGSFLPACVVIGAAWGWNTWSASERERWLSQRCAVLRQFVGKPNLPCAFMPKGMEMLAAQERVVLAQELVAP